MIRKEHDDDDHEQLVLRQGAWAVDVRDRSPEGNPTELSRDSKQTTRAHPPPGAKRSNGLTV